MPKSDAPGDREQDHRWVQIDRAAVDDRLEEVPLDELHRHDQAEGGEPDHPALVGERDQDGKQARHERSDERHERTDEDEDCEGERHGNAQQPEPDSDQQRVDEGRPFGRAVAGICGYLRELPAASCGISAGCLVVSMANGAGCVCGMPPLAARFRTFAVRVGWSVPGRRHRRRQSWFGERATFERRRGWTAV